MFSRLIFRIPRIHDFPFSVTPGGKTNRNAINKKIRRRLDYGFMFSPGFTLGIFDRKFTKPAVQRKYSFAVPARYDASASINPVCPCFFSSLFFFFFFSIGQKGGISFILGKNVYVEYYLESIMYRGWRGEAVDVNLFQ